MERWYPSTPAQSITGDWSEHVWSYILDQVKALGFEMVETYIPWSVHETEPGVYDWGQVDPRKNVEAFMELCEEKGLWLIVRPGPLINAELTDFGFPEWVLLDPEVQARTANGTVHFDAAWGLHPPRPFPVPSYASEQFYAYTGGWFDAICPVIARHLAPSGCIVTVQSDNESCYLFHDQPYATDYCDASISLFRSFLAERYGSISAHVRGVWRDARILRRDRAAARLRHRRLGGSASSSGLGRLQGIPDSLECGSLCPNVARAWNRWCPALP